MKKALLVLFAALFFSGGKVFAEPIVDGPRNPSKMIIWRSTNVAATTAVDATTAVKLSNSALLHAVQVSSPAAVMFSTNAVLKVYGSQDGSGNLLMQVNYSTANFSSMEQMRFVTDIYASSGLSVVFTTGDARNSDAAGSVQMIYSKGLPENYRVWQSSWFASDVSTHTLAKGPVLLHKVIVTSAATGTSNMRIYNEYTGTPVSTTIVSQIDLTEGEREYDFDVRLSSGLTVNIQQNGTVPATVMFLFKTNPPGDWDVWQSTRVTGSVTNRSLITGRAVLGGVLNGDGVADSMLTLYDSNGTATTKLTDVIGDTVFDFDDNRYSVGVSSGITATCVGNGQYTIRYKRLP